MEQAASVKVIKFLNGEQPDKQFDIGRMEDIFDRHAGKTGKPHRHDFYTVIWALAGSGTHLIDFQQYPIAPNTIFFVAPGQVHHIVTPERPQGWVITFTREFLAQNAISEDFLLNVNLFKQYGESPPLLLEGDIPEKLTPIAEGMHSVFQTPMPYYQEALGALLKLFLIYCNAACTLERPTKNSPKDGTWVLRDFKKLVEANFRQKHKVKDYAALMYITPKHLNKVVKELIGCTAKEYVQQRIFMESERLLLHTEANVKEVAYHLGFEEPLHFSGFFKKMSGTSPTEYRNKGRYPLLTTPA